MSEYWKSTPKYWCKFCSVFVKDTKFERAQHDATGRHQGNIQRSLRGLHREKQTEQRQQQRAKDEVARLNGLVPATGSSASAGGDTRVGAKPSFTNNNRPATLEDRKRQMEQLAALGVALPEEARPELAIAGEWKVVSQKIIGEEEKPLNTGVHKRKLDEAELEARAAGEMITKKKGWGSTFKSFPGKMGGTEDDIEALFKKAKKPTIKQEEENKKQEEDSRVKDEPEVKGEDAASTLQSIPTAEEAIVPAKEEDDPPAPAVVFKKRKKIAP